MSDITESEGVEKYEISQARHQASTTFSLVRDKIHTMRGKGLTFLVRKKIEKIEIDDAHES